ncbi:diguanylate cyclase (GGDEF)-like protein [Pseudomonas duriflava]|uniref:Diguanylate cyclase (GGDEF)-like protein n=1 Tax=Pseudomonas duriflava TaxID=459528 RepID=A0A562Q8G8_9PSED|nr:EAL domain-containing protein [Pseudomonas duriflava]TWI53033.1 diguanylate cyclase (GGDEF)-like protein [Pseudomonas duriflava]
MSSNHSLFSSREVIRDFIIVLVLGVAALLALVRFEFFEAVVRFSATHESWEVDEVFTALVIIGWCGFIFGFRRIVDMRKEIAARKQAQEEAYHLATHDNLTHLPNRRALQEHFSRAVGASNEPFFLSIFDLDGFKAINDIYGHGIGDTLLQDIGLRIGSALPQGDFLCRLGGDEFAILLHSAKSETAAKATLEGLARLVSSPCVLGSTVLTTAATYGVSRYPNDGTDMSTLLRRADVALYQGKRNGKNAIRFFDVTQDHVLEEQSRISQTLREALELSYIRPEYQPIVALGSMTIAGFEALARLDHPVHGSIPPDKFIPAAEDSGQMTELTDYLLLLACQDAQSWPEHLFLSFNLSAVDLRDPNLPARLENILIQTGLSPSRLEIEVTETAIIKDIKQAKLSLDTLRALGIKVSVDDFGTGYSSMAQISRFTFDKLKIDREFINSMIINEKDDKIVRCILGLGHGLNMPSIAEGIEHSYQATWLKSAGCEFGQGFLFSRAVPAADVLLLLEQHAKRLSLGYYEST